MARRPDGTIGAPADVEVIDRPSIETYDVNSAQFSILTDDETPHFLVIGSRGSSKTKLAELWHIKQVCRWSGKAISFMREKRQKLRRYLEQRLLPNFPSTWIQNPHDVRKAQDELAVRVANNVWLWFVTSFKKDDARGDDVVAAIIDETQLTPPESRENLILSCRRVIEAGGKKKQIQTLETGTYVDGWFMDYVERAQSDPRYRVIELSVTDNVHLETEFDRVTQHEIPSMVVSARSIMDPRRFSQEVGIWDDNAKRFRPQVYTSVGRVYWPFSRKTHVAEWSKNYAGKYIRRLYSSAHKGVGNDITTQLAAARFRVAKAFVSGVDVEAPPLAAVIGKIYQTPPGMPDLLWVVDEVGVEDEPDGTRLGQRIQSTGYSDVGVVPDAAGRHSDGGKSTVRLLRAVGLHVQGPKRNPADKDRQNALNAKLRNANDEVTLLIDPKCRHLIAALQGQRLTPKGDREAEMTDKEHHYARALGYLVHYFWAPKAKRQAA